MAWCRHSITCSRTACSCRRAHASRAAEHALCLIAVHVWFTWLWTYAPSRPTLPSCVDARPHVETRFTQACFARAAFRFVVRAATLKRQRARLKRGVFVIVLAVAFGVAARGCPRSVVYLFVPVVGQRPATLSGQGLAGVGRAAQQRKSLGASAT